MAGRPGGFRKDLSLRANGIVQLYFLFSFSDTRLEIHTYCASYSTDASAFCKVALTNDCDDGVVKAMIAQHISNYWVDISEVRTA